MASQDHLPLFEFEVPSSAGLTFIPLIVRFRLDAHGLRISLDDWQRLPYAARAALTASRIAASDAMPDDPDDPDFAGRLREAMRTHAGHLPEVSGPPPTLLPGDDVTAVPAGVIGQCELAGLTAPDIPTWAALSRFQRYSLAKLSRKATANHDFVPAMREFGLLR